MNRLAILLCASPVCASLLCASLLCANVFGAGSARAQSALEILHTFAGGADGSFPYAGLVRDANGAFYGTTLGGGSIGCNCGTVYRLLPPTAGSSAWTEQILHVFQGGGDGAFPWARVSLDNQGNIFGTTSQGGAFDFGTVYELSPIAGGGYGYSVLHAFLGGFDGEFPMTEVVRAGNDLLVGTTEFGGGFAQSGLIYELTPPAVNGAAWTRSTLYTFQGGPDGAQPVAIMRDSANAYYGTTLAGGGGGACRLGCGTVFRLARAGGDGPWTESILYAFPTNTAPDGGVIEASDGTLYGAEMFGGGAPGCSSPSGCGRVYRLAPPTGGGTPWTRQRLYSFTDADGVNPVGGLLLGTKGVIYGTTSLGTPQLGGGTIFAVTPPGGNHPAHWRERTLFSTNAQPSYGIRDFESALIAGGDGYVYGTAQGGTPTAGAPSPQGVVFRLRK